MFLKAVFDYAIPEHEMQFNNKECDPDNAESLEPKLRKLKLKNLLFLLRCIWDYERFKGISDVPVMCVYVVDGGLEGLQSHCMAHSL